MDARSDHSQGEPPPIELHRVSRRFGQQPVLREISLQLRAGETLAVIGESGCGKTVTMKLMMALIEPSAGEVRWFGRPLRERPGSELARDRLRFGYLFQGAALFDSLSVFENVAFGLRQNTRMPEEQVRQIVHERLREVGLSESVCEQKPAELSGGMKKRVGLARALALEPEVMLYDEPTTGLDPVMSDVINELILQTRARRPVTGVVVTHDMRTVRRVADRVAMLAPLARLEPGQPQIVYEGTPQEIFSTTDPHISRFIAGGRVEETAVQR